jgi:thiamine biosynthesis lipoprotein
VITAFRAMGTEVSVLLPGADARGEDGMAQRIAALFEQKEQRFSRFRPDSELSTLNRARGRFVASPELFDALARAQGYHALTRGLFDPAIGGALAALGYDRSFAPGALDRVDTPALPHERARFGSVTLEAATRVVARPAGLALDLGGMIKGRAVDEAAALLPATGAVDAGGDAVLRGAGPEGEGWLVDVEDPFDAARAVLTLRVRDRAVATSAVNRRFWRAGGLSAHHLIDPRTALPSRSDVVQATVVADRAELAEVLAKTALLMGADAGRGFLAEMARRAGVAAVLVTTARQVLRVGAMEVSDA